MTLSEQINEIMGHYEQGHVTKAEASSWLLRTIGQRPEETAPIPDLAIEAAAEAPTTEEGWAKQMIVRSYCSSLAPEEGAEIDRKMLKDIRRGVERIRELRDGN